MSRILYPYQAPLQPLFRASLFGPLVQVTPPSGQPVTLDEIKLHCRIDLPDDDSLLQSIAAAAMRYVQTESGRQLLTATYLVPVEAWFAGTLKLPKPPLQSVTTVNYYDPGGTLTTLDPTKYLVRTPLLLAGSIERAPFQYFPALQADRNYCVEITFVAGYGAPAQVPDTLKRAILLAVDWLYENRGEVSAEPPMAIRALIDCENYGNYA